MGAKATQQGFTRDYVGPYVLSGLIWLPWLPFPRLMAHMIDILCCWKIRPCIVHARRVQSRCWPWLGVQPCQNTDQETTQEDHKDPNMVYGTWHRVDGKWYIESIQRDPPNHGFWNLPSSQALEPDGRIPMFMWSLVLLVVHGSEVGIKQGVPNYGIMPGTHAVDSRFKLSSLGLASGSGAGL